MNTQHYDMKRIGKPFAVGLLAIGMIFALLMTAPSFVVSLNEVEFLPIILTIITIGLASWYNQSKILVISAMVLLYQALPLTNPNIYLIPVYKEILPSIMAGLFAYVSGTKSQQVSFGYLLQVTIGLLVIGVGVLIVNLAVRLIDIHQVLPENINMNLGTLAVYLAALGYSAAKVAKRDSDAVNLYVLFAIFILLVAMMALGHVSNSVLQIFLNIVLMFGVVRAAHQFAFEDELTGIRNRRALNDASTSLGKTYTVVMADVDHFKKFNDTYGHDAGDEVLRMVARLMDDVNGGGVAYRWGGEEFSLLFKNKTASQVKEHADLVRQSIEKYQFALRSDLRNESSKDGRGTMSQPTIVRVTCSFGIATVSDDEHFDDVIKRADEALYMSKKAGRNCVTFKKKDCSADADS